MPMNGKHPVNRRDPDLNDPVQAITVVDLLVKQIVNRAAKLIEHHPGASPGLEAIADDARELGRVAKVGIQSGGNLR